MEGLNTTNVYLGPFSGFKVFTYLGISNKKIVSPYRSFVEWWPKRSKTEAVCMMAMGQQGWKHEAPYFNCACGYYAFLSFEQALATLQLRHGIVPANFEFVALVVGWGKTITHDTGFRSQYMEIAAIHRGIYQYQANLDLAAKSLEIPTMHQNEMEDYAQDVGLLLSPETLP